MMHSAVSGVAPSYIKDMLTSVADMLEIRRIWIFRCSTCQNSHRLSSILYRWTSSVEQFARGNENCTDDPKRLQEQTEDILI